MNRFVLLSLVLSFAFAARADDRPNIVFILADDMGYGDVQALNPDSKIPTPHLDRLAGEGMTFTDAHSPSAVCTPTRYATLTGRYTWRSKMKTGVLNGYGRPLIEPERPTVASHLKSAGYHTAVIGKWHLGLGFQAKDDGKTWDWAKPLDYSPVDVGFERSLVIPASLDFPPYVYVEGHRITGLPDREQPAIGFPGYLRKGELGSDFSIVDCLDELTKQAAGHITKSATGDKPFFLYFPLTAPHKPVSPHPRFQGKTDLGPYGDFIVQVDWTVGEILKAIDDAGIAENTLVIYTSDNGSFMFRETDTDAPDHVKDETVQAYFEGNHTANGLLRGTKADIWEAGHRVPFFVRWPKVIKAGSTSDRTICHVDLFATAAEVAKTKLPPPTVAAPDSFSLVPLFKNQPGKFKRAPVVHHSGSGMFAIRDGDWKLVLGTGSGGREQPRGKKFESPYKLFNLKEDLGETNDRFSSEPEIAQRLETELLKMFVFEKSRR
ncbi:MAG: arylsulfatase [Verrucomicrobiales bacterium]|nr:arylsulfatase [Verrucomicrobiales bacterium]